MINFKPKYPAYGKNLAEKQRWNNSPSGFVYVCVGGDAFRSAQNHNLDRDDAAMVITPGQDPKTLTWPVKDSSVIIEWDGSVPAKLIIELVRCLLRALAVSVTVYPTWVDYNSPPGYYDKSQQPIKFIHSREVIRTYYPKQAKA